MENKNQYTKFVGMLVASFIAMYITMYLNTYAIDHVYFSLTRFYMSCLGISTLAIIMFVAMRAMYQNKKKNKDKESFANLPNIAILTSERAAIEDPEVIKLANDIIEAQKKEIEEMKAMIQRLEDK